MRGWRDRFFGLLELRILHELLLELHHDYADTVGVVLGGLLDINVI